MKIIKILGFLLVLLVTIALAMSLLTSPEGKLESTIIINASPASVYEECVNIRKMDAWSPWYGIEPEAFSYEGPEEGEGATSVWKSENPDLGNGSLTITEAIRNESIKTKMVFEGFEGDFSSHIQLEPEGDGTKVTWGYTYSNLDLIGRFFMSMMDVNEDMTPMFEKGLASLKETVESKPTPEPEIEEPMMEMDSTKVDVEE